MDADGAHLFCDWRQKASKKRRIALGNINRRQKASKKRQKAPNQTIRRQNWSFRRRGGGIRVILAKMVVFEYF